MKVAKTLSHTSHTIRLLLGFCALNNSPVCVCVFGLNNRKQRLFAIRCSRSGFERILSSSSSLVFVYCFRFVSRLMDCHSGLPIPVERDDKFRPTHTHTTVTRASYDFDIHGAMQSKWFVRCNRKMKLSVRISLAVLEFFPVFISFILPWMTMQQIEMTKTFVRHKDLNIQETVHGK